MADDQNINLTATFKATADVSAFDKAIAAVEKLEGKIKGLETLQGSLAKSQQIATRAQDKIKEEGIKGAAAKAVIREAAAAINKELGLSGRTATQLRDAKIDPTAISNAAKTIKGFGEVTQTLGKLSKDLSEKGIEPLRAQLERDQGILKRALAGNAPTARPSRVSGQEVPAGMTAAAAARLESKSAPSKDISTKELLAQSQSIKQKAAKETAQVREGAAKVEQAVVQTIQTAAEALKAAGSAASQTSRAQGRIRQATGTSRIIGDTLGIGPGGTYGGAGAGAGAGPAGPRARRPSGYDEATNKASESLNREAKAAKETAVAMKGLAEAKKQVVTGEKSVAASTGRVIDQLMKEMKAAPKAAAALHQMLRRMEAANNPKYSRGFAQTSQSLNNISGSAQQTGRSFMGLARNGDSFLGQVKQVAVMATSFSILQGVASKLQEGFSHLTGGIIGFNQMLERTYVGFNRLFTNQAQQVETARGFGDMTKEVEYLKMGYDSASSAASGVVETIREFANVTPFRFEELAQATLRMRAFGFSLDEVLYKSAETESGFDGAVVAIGDAVSALGGGAPEFQRITYALGQMKQAGRVYQNDMMQLANAGIGGYQYIADSLKLEITKGGTGQRKDVKEQYKKLYDDLSTNTIETVRRLTTNGEISGEAASRAIIAGLKKDFGGGMKDFSKTFVGAWSTLADTSQSLVATAFKPFYDDFVRNIYQLGQFMQSPAAAAIAEGFQPIIQKISRQVFTFVNTAQSILGKLVNDVAGAFANVKTEAGKLAINGAAALELLRDGIGVVSGLLQNDMTRGIITATIAFKSLTAFASHNPMLTAITGVIIMLGALRQAYEQNFLGFKTAIDGLVVSVTPLVEVIKAELLPVLAEIGIFTSQYIVAGLVLAFKIAAPFIEAVVVAVASLLKIMKPLVPLVAGLVIALVTKFAYKEIVSGFRLVAREIAHAAWQMRKFGRDAVIASEQAKAVALGPTRAQLGAGNQLLAPGRSSGFKVNGNPVTGGAILGGIKNNAMGIGMAGTIGAGLAEMAGVPAEITSVVSNVSAALLGFGILKDLFSPSILNGIKEGLSGVGTKLGDFGGLLGTFITRLAGMQITLGAMSVGLGPLLLAIIAIGGLVALIVSLVSNFGKGTGAPKPGSVEDNYLRNNYSAGTDVSGPGYLGAQADPSAKGDTTRRKTKQELEDLQRINAQRRLGNNLQEKLAAKGDAGRAAAAKAAKAEAAAQKLLVDQQKASEAAQARKNKLQEKYNRLLQQAQRNLQLSTGLLEELAKGALKELLDPRDLERVNPYTGMAEAALSLEDVLRTESALLFTSYQNAQGITKSFAEYADILDGIVPLQEKDRTEGKLNLAAVRERLKIEKERRKEIELIVRAAETEYDLGLATLQQYDESIDPLQRAVQLRQAQSQYEKDVRDTRMSGLEMALDQAESSSQWAVAEKVISQKLEDIGAGQDLILKELESRFEEYNNRVADIMANPNFSAATRTTKLKEALDLLTSDLETGFGITRDAIQGQFDLLNSQIAIARDASLPDFQAFFETLTNPAIPEITWGQTLGVALGDVFRQIISDMTAYFTEISNLAAQIAGVAANATGGTPPPPKPPTPPTPPTPPKPPTKPVVLPPGQGVGGGFKTSGAVTINGQTILVKPGDTMAETLAQANALNKATTPKPPAPVIKPSIPAMKKFASGGVLGSGLSLVGENGPELLLPKTSGLVLNNSISSRIMSMLSGAGAAGSGGNVTINVNNPVIRNDADIRKLATEISKVQASQFRTQGGRL